MLITKQFRTIKTLAEGLFCFVLFWEKCILNKNYCLVISNLQASILFVSFMLEAKMET